MASFPISKFGENLSVTGIVALSQAAVGVAVGLLVADKMGRDARQRTAIALLGAGMATLIPFVAGVFERVNNRPGSTRGMRRRLDRIRRDSGNVEFDDIV
jgi:hypothetical protein